MHTWRYALATLPPLALLMMAALFGGWWAAAALVWLTLLAAGLDHLLTPPAGGDPHEPAADTLSAVLAVGHLALLALAAGAFGDATRSLGETVTLFLGTASFLGQISHPNAHELIHRSPRALRRLGAAVYITMLFGHHVSAHRLVHHVHVGTGNDPNTPHRGESFWAFLPRAWRQSFAAGLAEERRRDARRSQGPNPYLWYVGGGVLTLCLAYVLGGPGGLIGQIGLGVFAGGQVLLSDYIQHYGLYRQPLPDGRLEPVGPRHSWNAPRGFTSFLMINAPSHSDHHMHPATPYDALAMPPDAPRLPWSLPIMAVLATMPRQWRRIMDKRAEKVMALAPRA